MQFNVNLAQPISWNDDAFDKLVIPGDQKALIRSLVEANAMLKDGNSMPLVDHDVVVGKGQGVIISLFGPPGVGKTLSAEATSEHLRRPLYRVGSGDLGSSAMETDRELRRA